MYTIQTITQAVGNLSESEKHTLFQIITEHGELLNKVIPDLPLVAHASGKQQLNHTLAEQYDAWSNAKT